jgi:hypothetical protein
MEEYDLYLRKVQDMPYKQYLKTDHWLGFREKCLEFYGRCQLCSTTSNLMVHHKSYDNKGRETFLDVVVLCGYCHSKMHGMSTDVAKSKGFDVAKYERIKFILENKYYFQLGGVLVEYVVSKNKKLDTPYNRKEIASNLGSYVKYLNKISEASFFAEELKLVRAINNNINAFARMHAIITGTLELEVKTIGDLIDRCINIRDGYKNDIPYGKVYGDLEEAEEIRSSGRAMSNDLKPYTKIEMPSENILKFFSNLMNERMHNSENFNDYIKMKEKIATQNELRGLYKKVVFELQGYYERYFEDKNAAEFSDLLD